MLLEIEGCKVRKLLQRVRETLALSGYRAFVRVFCYRYNFQAFPLQRGVRVDYRLDMDTGRLYKPYYGEEKQHEILSYKR